MAAAAAAASLRDLRAAMEAFDGCGLKRTATNTVFAEGVAEGGVMLIGEAPGRDEDRVGKPFVGRAGQLLDKMLAAIALDRKTNAYITNVINWRPPDNRDPSPEEAAQCLPFLRRHIELANPKLIEELDLVPEEGETLTALTFRDLICLAEDASDAVLAADRAPALAEQARSRDPRRLREAAERCEEVRQSLELNVTEDLALSALGFRLAALAGAR